MRLDENKKIMDYEDVRNRIKECERYITSLKEELNEREVDSIGFDYFDKDLDIRIKEVEVTLIELKEILKTEPPQPELPPQGLLFKIEGKIEELEIQYIKNYFDDRAYTTVKYERDRKIEISLTMILMALGNFASAASLNKFENRKMNVSSFVKGKINGKPFYGWLGKTVIKENDYVEMVVIEKDNCYIAYAITLPEKRLIMITPECEYGRYYMVKLSVLGSIILGLIPFFFLLHFLVLVMIII